MPCLVPIIHVNGINQLLLSKSLLVATVCSYTLEKMLTSYIIMHNRYISKTLSKKYTAHIQCTCREGHAPLDNIKFIDQVHRHNTEYWMNGRISTIKTVFSYGFFIKCQCTELHSLYRNEWHYLLNMFTQTWFFKIQQYTWNCSNPAFASVTFAPGLITPEK